MVISKIWKEKILKIKKLLYKQVSKVLKFKQIIMVNIVKQLI